MLAAAALTAAYRFAPRSDETTGIEVARYSSLRQFAASLLDAFNNTYSHCFRKCDKFSTILVISVEKQCSPSFVTSLRFLGNQPSCACKKVSL